MEQTPEEIKKAALDNIEKVAKETAVKEVEAVNKSVEDLKAELVAKSAEITELNDKIGVVSASFKKLSQTQKSSEVSNIPLEEVIKHAIVSNKALGEAAYLQTESAPTSVKLEEVAKDITNASFTGNSLINSTQVVRPGVYATPFAPVWLKNLFPQTSTDGGAIVIEQIKGYTGGVDVWTRGTGAAGADVAKPDVGIEFKDVTITPKWLAGKMRVNRELLMNVSYLSSSISNALLYSPVGLYARENKLITDYLAANAIAYAGNKTIGIEKIVDAAFGQMLGNYIQADYVFLNNFDYVEYIALNKAAGSGEYDLPDGLQVSVIDGALFINQLKAVPVPSIAKGTAYVVASSEFEFLTRMGAELRMFEQSKDDAEVNKVLFRLEEMAEFFARNLNGAIKITLTTP